MLNVYYSKEKDARNWLRLKSTYPLDFQFSKYYPFNKNIPLDEKNLQKIANSISKKKLATLDRKAAILARAWSVQEDKYLKKITDYLNLPFKKYEFRACLTTAYRMPYDIRDRWFMVSANKSISDQITGIVHEIFHHYHLIKHPKANFDELENEVKKLLNSMNTSN